MNAGFLISWFLFLAIWLLPIFVREFRNSAQLTLAYWFVILLHQAVAITNAFLFPTVSALGDAHGFHVKAMVLAQSGEFTFPIGDFFLKNALGVVYWLLGPSLMLGQQLSILVFSISCIVLVKILYQLELSRYKVSILLLFGALPTMVFLGSIILRESYEILFFMLVVHFGFKMHITRVITRNFLFMTISAIGLGIHHQALSVYALFLVTLFLLWSVRPAAYLWSVKKLRLFAFLIIPVIILVVSTYMASNSSLSMFATGNLELLERAAHYRSVATVTRASYGIPLDLSSPFKIFSSSLMIYIYYLFAPFPWKIYSSVDFYASMESLMRFVLICFALKDWRNACGARRRIISLMLIIYFSLTFLWAIGTTNYGTAIRHHMLSWWILVVIGLPLLIDTLSRTLRGFSIRRH